MADKTDHTEQAMAELDHFEGEGYAEFAVIDPESRETVGGVYPYVEEEKLPEDASRGDLFRIEYDTETEEILKLEYLQDETRKQKAVNARHLIELQEEDVISSADGTDDTGDDDT